MKIPLSVRAGAAGSLPILLALAGPAALTAAARAQCEGRFLPTIAPDHGLRGRQVTSMTQWDPDGAGPLGMVTILAGALVAPGDSPSHNIATWTPRGDDGVWGALGAGLDSQVADVVVFNGQPVVAVQEAGQPGQPASAVLRWTGSAWEPMGAIAGPVHALQIFGGQLYAGGDFTIAGAPTSHDLARWNGSAWVPVGGSGPDGRVLDMAVFGGNLIVAGEFPTISGVVASNLGQWNGSSWSAVGAGTVGLVTSLTTHSGELIAGGHFTAVGGGLIPANRIARWNGSAWSTLGTGLNHRVWAVHSHGGRLYAGGQFTVAGGVPAQHVARWDGASWQALGAGADDIVNSFNTITASELMIGGYFSHAGGLQAARAVRFTSDSGRWSPLGVGPNNGIHTLAVADGTLYAGGNFNTFDGLAAPGLARLSGGEWTTVQSGLHHSSGIPALVNAISLRPTGAVGNPFELIVGGSFTHAGGPPATSGSVAAGNIASWSPFIAPAGWNKLGTGLNGPVYAQSVQGNDVYVGGTFSTAGGVSALGLARWNGTAWTGRSLPGFSTSMFDAVYAIQPFGGQIVAGGRFQHAGLSNIAILSGTTWSPMGLGMDGEVHALTVYQGQLIAGGAFDFAGVGFSHGLARWTGSDWAPVGPGQPIVDVYALAVYNGNLYVGGYNPATNGAVVHRWNGSSWSTIYSGAGTTTLDALAVYNNELILGGRFDIAQTNSRNWARWAESGSPWLTEQPQSITRAVGANGTLTARPMFGYEAFGALSFQWRRNGVPITDGAGGAGPGGGVVSGAAGPLDPGAAATLTITGVKPGDAGNYTCTISTPCGSTTSAAATLTVTGGCRADLTGDGLVDFSDYLEFLNLYDAADPAADLTGDGLVDFADYLEFLNHYDAGC